MIVTIVQFAPELRNPEANIARLEKVFKNVPPSDLVILPELANAGYLFDGPGDAWEYAETIGSHGLFQEFLVSQAKAMGTHIVSGISERYRGKLYNTAVLAGENGIVGKYRKMHLFMNEKDIFTPGNAGLPVFELKGFRIGILICFDYIFPEPWRIMAEKGADLICHPSNIITLNPLKVLPALALVNRVYIATANRTGNEGTLAFNGQSALHDPLGNVVCKASADMEELLTQKIDLQLSRNKMITARNHAFLDRMPGLYHP